MATTKTLQNLLEEGHDVRTILRVIETESVHLAPDSFSARTFCADLLTKVLADPPGDEDNRRELAYRLVIAFNKIHKAVKE